MSEQSRRTGSYLRTYVKGLRERIAELEAEKESIGNNALAILSSQLCNKHSDEIKTQTFAEFQAEEKRIGCTRCLEQRIEKANEECERIKTTYMLADDETVPVNANSINVFFSQLQAILKPPGS